MFYIPATKTSRMVCAVMRGVSQQLNPAEGQALLEISGWSAIMLCRQPTSHPRLLNRGRNKFSMRWRTSARKPSVLKVNSSFSAMRNFKDQKLCQRSTLFGHSADARIALRTTIMKSLYRKTVGGARDTKTFCGADAHQNQSQKTENTMDQISRLFGSLDEVGEGVKP
jgi:hypothetical protein